MRGIRGLRSRLSRSMLGRSLASLAWSHAARSGSVRFGQVLQGRERRLLVVGNVYVSYEKESLAKRGNQLNSRTELERDGSAAK